MAAAKGTQLDLLFLVILYYLYIYLLARNVYSEPILLSNEPGHRLHCLNETSLAIGQQQMIEHDQIWMCFLKSL